MTMHSRRRALYVVIAFSVIALFLLVLGAVVIVAQSSSESARLAAKVSDDFADYRDVTEARSEKASAERTALNDQVATLADQNETLSKQVKALTELLEKYGIDVPPGGGSISSAPPNSSTSPAAPRASSGGSSAPARPVTPAPAVPRPERDDLTVCLPVLGCLL